MKLRCLNKALCLALACAALMGTPALAQVSVTQTEPLSFGRFAIPDTNTEARITLQTGGSYTDNGNVAMIIEPQPGEYTISGPISQPYSVTLPTSVTLSGPQGTMTLDDFTVSPGVLMTDGAGEDYIIIGGRLRTNGLAPGLPDGTYNGTLTITVNF